MRRTLIIIGLVNLMAVVVLPLAALGSSPIFNALSAEGYFEKFSNGRSVLVGYVEDVSPERVVIAEGRSLMWARVELRVDCVLAGNANKREYFYNNNVFYQTDSGGLKVSLMPDVAWISPGDYILILVKDFERMGTKIRKIQKTFYLLSADCSDSASLYETNSAINPEKLEDLKKSKKLDGIYSAIEKSPKKAGITIGEVRRIINNCNNKEGE